MASEVILQNVTVQKGVSASAGYLLLGEVVVETRKPEAPVQGICLESMLTTNINQSGLTPQNNGGRYGLHI